MVSTYLTRSPKKITTRNTSARKVYTASRWVFLHSSWTNMYKSHWKSSSNKLWGEKNKIWKKPDNQHLRVVDLFLDELHNYTKLIISTNLWAVKSYGSFRTSRFCMLSGAKTLFKTGRTTKRRDVCQAWRRRKSLVRSFLPTENPGDRRKNVCRTGVPCKPSQPLK